MMVAAAKRKRRSQVEIDSIRSAMYNMLAQEHPMTCRQLFYRLVSAGVIGKSETEYNNTVVRLLSAMRRAGELPFRWLADATRWQRKPATYCSAREMLERSCRLYRQALWADQKAYVEIWLEKDALAGVLYPITSQWDVPLMVTRGYPSLSFLYSAVEAMQQEKRPCFLYYLGDWDPSGVDIARKVEADLREFAPEVDLRFERVAITLDQVDRWNLQTRPTKSTDSRAKNFEGESVEVDAIEPAQLRELVAGCIEQHIDQRILAQTRATEEAERDTLRTFLANTAPGTL